jgi:hypothetical protein
MAYRRVAPDADAWTSLVVKANQLDRVEWLSSMILAFLAEQMAVLELDLVGGHAI